MTPSGSFIEDFVPDRVRCSPLMECGGYMILDPLTDTRFFSALREEALALAPHAAWSAVSTPDDEEHRGGTPPRQLWSAEGGSVQDALFQSPDVVELLRSLTQLPIQPSGGRGTYSYYRKGDFLGLHRDIQTCELVVNTCLYEARPEVADEGLRAYPTRSDEPLSQIRERPDVGAVSVPIRPGQSLVMFGGIVPHEVLPMSAGQTRIMSLLCYAA